MSAEKIGVLLSNLGTPSAPSKPAIRRFLAEFLADPRVIEFKPRWLWWLILHAIILRIRPKKILPVYQRVWMKQGSPLLIMCEQIKSKLQRVLGEQYTVALGMRYGEPSLKSGLLALRQAGVKKVIVLPLYPQYSATTTASTVDEVMRLLRRCRVLPDVRFILDYHVNPAYLAALSDTIQQTWEKAAQKNYLLFSYHGLPQRYVDQGDPYYQQCLATTEHIVSQLKLSDGQWGMSFQSRVGREPWLMPYTDKQLIKLAQSGIKKVSVICPGFSVDCIETLDEIAVENKAIFLASGGIDLDYIPCLNDQPKHLEVLKTLVQLKA